MAIKCIGYFTFKLHVYFITRYSSKEHPLHDQVIEPDVSGEPDKSGEPDESAEHDGSAETIESGEPYEFAEPDGMAW